MRQPGPFRGPHHEKSTCPQDGQRGTERGRAEAHALVRECQRAEGGARIRDFRLHACPELAGRLAVAGAHPAPGQQAQGPAIELGNGATSEPAPDDAEDHAAHDEGGARALPRAEIPPLGTPGPRRLAEGGGEVDLVLQAPVDDVAIPAHPERIEMERQPSAGRLRGLATGRGVEGEPADAVDPGLNRRASAGTRSASGGSCRYRSRATPSRGRAATPRRPTCSSSDSTV